MRIIHVVSTYPPYRGGQGNVARDIAERTAARGHEVVVIAPMQVASEELRVKSDRKSNTISAKGGSPPKDGQAASGGNYQLSTINSVLHFGNAAWCPSIARTLEELQPDIVHLHWPFIGGVAPVLAWRRRGRTPKFLSLFRAKLRKDSETRRLVVHHHMDLLASGWRGVLFAVYQRWTLPRLLRVADRVVVSSLDYARHGALAPFVNKLGDRIVEIPLGVDVERFQPTVLPPTPPTPHKGRGEIKKSFSPSRGEGELEGEGLRVLFVGGLDRAHAFKGLPVLLNAIARTPNVRLRVVGDGDLRSQYERQAHELGIIDRVEFLDAVSDEALPNVYRGADVLVLPSTSRSEAFGVVLLEAMASGIPVIASDLPGVRTVVVDGETGFLISPGDAAALADRITAFARDPELRRRMGAAARRRVEERYDWDRIIDRWLEVYPEGTK